MKFTLLRLVRYFVNIAFFMYLIVIPIFWFSMISKYLGEGTDQVLVTQIQHGPLPAPGPEPRAAVTAGEPFALQEEAATLWVKTDSLLHYIFFTRIGDRDGFGLDLIGMLFGFALVFLLKLILDSIHKEGVFTARNAQRIMLMGWVLVAKFFYLLVISHWMGKFLESYDLPYPWARGHNPDSGDLYLGILIFCIGLIYKEGVKLKKEAELVI